MTELDYRSDSKLYQKRDFLFALFVAAMVMVNTLGTKITTILGVRVSVGIFFVPVLFLTTDIIGEVFGRKEASRFVNMATIMLVLLFLMMSLCIAIKPNESWNLQEQYATVFGSSLRMTIASLISFVVAQQLDVFMFSLWGKITKGKHLWIRNNMSTIVSQLIDTTIFEFVAFWHLTPKFTTGYIFSLILPYWLFKVVFALLDTPLCYLGVWWLSGKKKSNSSTTPETT
ncbi:MAG: queuosine precursor transporter [Spirochaetales bacterium]|nr:queuosine precursor transporter [Spirochaetales bacterium]